MHQGLNKLPEPNPRLGDIFEGERSFRLIQILFVVVLLVMLGFGRFALHRLGAYLAFKSIEGHIERKVLNMVAEEALRK